MLFRALRFFCVLAIKLKRAKHAGSGAAYTESNLTVREVFARTGELLSAYLHIPCGVGGETPQTHYLKGSRYCSQTSMTYRNRVI